MTKSKPAPGPHVFEMRSAAHIEAVVSPLRDQILQVVANQAPWSPKSPDAPGVSIAEIGAQLGRSPNSLYRHLEVLLDAGLIAEAGPEPSGGRAAQTYRAVGEVYHLVQPERRGRALDALCKYHERAAAHAGKESAAAARDRAVPPDKRDPGVPDHGMIVMSGWLDDDQREQLRDAMFTIAQIYQSAERRPGTKLVATSLFIRPVRLADGSTAAEPPGDVS